MPIVEKGRLRVFLGMSAGVGKTYAMLEAGHALKQDGFDVVIGVVETHGRVETAELLDGFEILPRRLVSYRGLKLQEFDIDGCLKRAPRVVLVDELAHTNPSGCRHQKRYQDILELLDAGITVLTTVNVQHFESRKDLVERITSVSIRETVPDSFLEIAHQIEVVDIAPEELLKRLKEGKIYQGAKAVQAAENFFKIDALTALREIALRMTAERVDHDLQKFHETKKLADPWRSNERLMVAISHSPHSERLIRATRRLAYGLEAAWIAVHVDNGAALKEGDQKQLAKNIALAGELNAEVVATSENDIANALRRIARQKNITQIILGRPARRAIRDRLQGSLLDRLVRENFEIDVHVIRQDEAPRTKTAFRPRIRFEAQLQAYWNTACLLVGVTLINGLLNPFVGYRAVGFLFLLAVLSVGASASLGPTLFAATVSALLWNVFFIPPLFSFEMREPADVVLCLIYFVVAAVSGSLTNQIRAQARVLREREDRTNLLYEVAQDIAQGRQKNEFLVRINERVGKLLGGRCSIYLVDRGGKIDVETPRPYAEGLTEKERGVALWAFSSGKRAGWSTETLSESPALFLPLEGLQEKVGVLVYRPHADVRLHLEQENLLRGVARQLATALERHFFEQRARDSQKLEASEKLHQTLLNSISHELRTPLTAINGAASALGEADVAENPVLVRDFAAQLLDSTDRLNRVIENLLDMSRINAGVLSLKKEWQDVGELINLSVKKLSKNLRDHRVVIEQTESLPLIEMDFRLFEHAFANLLLNAVNYTPKNTRIWIRAKRVADRLFIMIEDEGAGISAELQEKVFEKFYRIPGTPTGGTGLGLSIARGLAELHGGSLKMKNRDEGGACFIFSFPIREMPALPENDGGFE